MEGTTPPARRGLDGVVAGQTRLSHVDGLAGQLIIGGYELTELAGRVSFEEAAHLLWRGALPGTEELEELRRDLAALRPVPAQTIRVVRGAAQAPPIDALRMACATLSLDLDAPDDISPAADIAAAKMLTARFPTLVAAHARVSAVCRANVHQHVEHRSRCAAVQRTLERTDRAGHGAHHVRTRTGDHAGGERGRVHAVVDHGHPIRVDRPSRDRVGLVAMYHIEEVRGVR